MKNSRRAALIVLADFLEKISLGQYVPTPEEEGICSIINSFLIDSDCDRIDATIVYIYVIRMFSEWPEYSGNPNYPVPGPGGPVMAYRNNSGCMFDNNQDYGSARLRLCGFLSDRIRARLGC